MNTWFKSLLLSLFMILVCGCNAIIDSTASNPNLKSAEFDLPKGGLIPVSDTVPHPSKLEVDVTANGRVSTLNSIDVVKVGKNIPYTYSAGRVNNTPGFDWYVSKHFALKSNRPEEQVLLYMELLEMSFPHYIELFGMTPPDLENKRMAAVYGSSKTETQIFVPDDNITRGISAGGEAMFYNLVGYSFPSAREQHQRYIVVHEQGHVFQMALMDYSGWLPTWFTEGTADALAHHYYDPDKKQLKVMVFDRASPMDYIKRGIREYEDLNSPTIEDMTNNPKLYRGINFLIVHFMLDDPDRSHKFKAYRDEMAAMRQSDYGAGKTLSHQLMKDIFGDWEQVERDFSDFVASIDKTFNTAAGPWEQDGNQLWVRVLNNSFEHGSPRMDILLKPGNNPTFSPFKFDQPLPEVSSLVSTPQRGNDAPTLAIEVEYLKDHLHRGHVGLGLGLQVTEQNMERLKVDRKVGTFEQKSYKPDEDQLLQIKVQQGQTLSVEAESLGGENIKYALSPALVRELEGQQQPMLGMSVTVNKTHLDILLRSQNNSQLERFKISADIRTKLLSRNMALLAEKAEHRITPFLDDGRELNPVPLNTAIDGEVNPWANPADRAISRLFRAIWRLGDKAPESLTTMYNAMIAATPKNRDVQLASLKQFNDASEVLVNDIVISGATEVEINRALIELSGLHLRTEWRQMQSDGEQMISAVIRNQGDHPAKGEMLMTQQGNRTYAKPIVLNQKEKMSQDMVTTPTTRRSGKDIKVTAKIEWQGQLLELTVKENARQYPWSSMAILEGNKVNKNGVQVVSEFRGPHAGETKGKVLLQAYPSNMFEQSYIEQDITISPYEIRQFEHRFTLKNGNQNIPYAVDVSFDLVIDGEPVLLSERVMIN